MSAALSAAEQGRNRTFLDQIRAAGVDLRQSLRDTPQADLLKREHDVLAHYHEALAGLREATRTDRAGGRAQGNRRRRSKA